MAQNATPATDAQDETELDDLSAVDLSAGQTFRASNGERVEIVEDDLSGSKPLLVRYPDRDPDLNEDGEEVPATARMSRYSFMDAARFDGYELVSEDAADADEDENADDHVEGEFHGRIPCPECGRFMSTGYDGEGFPIARCSRADCPGVYDDAELRERGLWTEGDEGVEVEA